MNKQDELLEKFQVEELEQRFEMKAWINIVDHDPSNPNPDGEVIGIKFGV
tara:strand:+ start:177 stop:326 length:150 start_codon:yes stop_codon:yes gene_type:complete